MTSQAPKNDKPGCLAMIQRALGLTPKTAGPEPLLCHLRQHFLSPAELNFHRVLTGVVGDRLMICPKVSLGDLFYVKTSDRSARTTWRNQIDRKHVDFLLCDPQTVRPLLGIELDDRSHRRPDRVKRDHLVDRVFAAAGLPLYRVPVLRSYNTRELAAALREQLGPDGPLAALPAGTQSPEPAAATPAPSAPPVSYTHLTLPTN